MDMKRSIEGFSALAQETRLEVLRLLVRAGADGMLAGEIAAGLGVRQNTMSTNLAVLLRAGLVRNEREGRTIRYFADFGGIRDLVAFLMEDCCGGRPEICRPAIEALVCGCAEPVQ
jgi:Predicted transcriptional regulator